MLGQGFIYESADYFNDGLAVVENGDSKYSIINKQGEVVNSGLTRYHGIGCSYVSLNQTQ